MEIANTQKPVIRQAAREDSRQLTSLFQRAMYEHKHADWSYPTDWIGTPRFLVGEEEGDGESRQIVACLAAAADPPPAAWVRLAASTSRRDVGQVMADMVERICPYLIADGVTELGWLQANSWPERIMEQMGFSITNWIVTYVKFGLPDLAKMNSRIELRSVELEDMEALALIEEEAFDPLWRHSASGLRVAFSQSLSFDVALLEGRPVGFQYSAQGIDAATAHLARITVHPKVQGKGVGSALMNRAVESYRRMHIRNVTLNTQLDNHASHRLYEKFGFRSIDSSIPLWVMPIKSPEEES